MNDVPLIRRPDVNDINTSLIAIKKQLKQLNEAVGLIDVPDVDLTPFVRKDEVVNVIESGNMNPVTSNAVAGYTVDEVTSGNMHPVTSNAVSQCSSYSTEEVFTGSYWIDGRKIYKKTFVCNTTFQVAANTWVTISNYFTGMQNFLTVIDTITDTEYKIDKKAKAEYWSKLITAGLQVLGFTGWSFTANEGTVTLYYTKTTDTATRSIPTEETR